MGRLRELFTPSMGVSMIAVVIASAGSATAATLITGKQIRDGSIESVDIRNGSIIGRDLKSGTVTGLRVADGSLTAADLATDAVGSDEIANDTVGSDEIANDTVTNDDLAGGVRLAKLGTQIGSGMFGVPSVANGACTGQVFNVGDVTEGDLVVLKPMATIPTGLFLLPAHSPADGKGAYLLCNFSGGGYAGGTINAFIWVI